MKIGKSDCLGFAILCIMIALKTLFVRHVMGITYEIAGLVPSLLIVGAKIRKFSDIGIKNNPQNLNKDKIVAAPFFHPNNSNNSLFIRKMLECEFRGQGEGGIRRICYGVIVKKNGHCGLEAMACVDATSSRHRQSAKLRLRADPRWHRLHSVARYEWSKLSLTAWLLRH